MLIYALRKKQKLNDLVALSIYFENDAIFLSVLWIKNFVHTKTISPATLFFVLGTINLYIPLQI